jgi:hypothetical protein
MGKFFTKFVRVQECLPLEDEMRIYNYYYVKPHLYHEAHLALLLCVYFRRNSGEDSFCFTEILIF